MSFIEEVKAAVDGRFFRPRKRKKVYKTTEEIIREELDKPEYKHI